MDLVSSQNEARVEIQPGFCWDDQDAYLFDIDGTILRCRDRVHIDSVATSVHRITGFEITLEGIALQGNTDTGILREACQRAGIPADILEPQVSAILDAMCNNVADRRSELKLELMPGIEQTLSHLADRGAILGVATGNLEMIGWIKIEHAGLREHFHFGGFSDHFPVRSELIGQAARKARALAGANARVCVVGDTPRDIEAAHSNSLPVIAVATGRTSFDDLMQHRPEVCATSLADLLAASRSLQ
ncbi:MAG TPA: HAD hydrolase-like protein [Terracidiphilus sp.]|nr:HAD hydrolase-like protein [Terracidiphilus sp.]